MAYAQLALAGLQIVLWIMNKITADQQRQAGADEEIAKSALAILGKTETGKRIMEKLDAMAPAERDDFTDALGGAGGQR